MQCSAFEVVDWPITFPETCDKQGSVVTLWEIYVLQTSSGRSGSAITCVVCADALDDICSKEDARQWRLEVVQTCSGMPESRGLDGIAPLHAECPKGFAPQVGLRTKEN